MFLVKKRLDDGDSEMESRSVGKVGGRVIAWWPLACRRTDQVGGKGRLPKVEDEEDEWRRLKDEGFRVFMVRVSGFKPRPF